MSNESTSKKLHKPSTTEFSIENILDAKPDNGGVVEASSSKSDLPLTSCIEPSSNAVSPTTANFKALFDSLVTQSSTLYERYLEGLRSSVLNQLMGVAAADQLMLLEFQKRAAINASLSAAIPLDLSATKVSTGSSTQNHSSFLLSPTTATINNPFLPLTSAAADGSAFTAASNAKISASAPESTETSCRTSSSDNLFTGTPFGSAGRTRAVSAASIGNAAAALGRWPIGLFSGQLASIAKGLATRPELDKQDVDESNGSDMESERSSISGCDEIPLPSNFTANKFDNSNGNNSTGSTRKGLSNADGGTAAGTGQDNTKKKKSRTVFSRQQVYHLEFMFNRKRYLSSADRSKLAEKLHLTETQVKIWFQNRRNKWKRQLNIDLDTVNSTAPNFHNILQQHGLTSPTKSEFASQHSALNPFLLSAPAPASPTNSNGVACSTKSASKDHVQLGSLLAIGATNTQNID